MWQVIKSHPLAAVAAVLVHVVVILIVAINIEWFRNVPESGQREEIEVIEAKAITEQELEAREQRKQAAERRKREAELARQRERQRQAELKRQAEEKKRQEALQRKREAEAKRQAELKKQREAEEAKRREEEARKQKELEEQRRREEAERKQREEELRRQQEQDERELQAKLKAEAEAQARREWLAKHAPTIKQYEARIKDSIKRQWKLPDTAQSGMRCEIMVRLLPGGEVASIRVTKSSGDPAFDQSVIDAVKNASPLPVPSVDSGLFDEFREVNFPFATEDKR